MKKRKYIIFGLIVIIIVGGALAILKKRLHDKATLAKPKEHLQAVETLIVSSGNLEVTRHYLGIIESYTKSDLSARISGNIVSIKKREGDPVREGELVAVIDDRELLDKAEATHAEFLSTQQKLAGAKSAYETQKSIYERDMILYKAGAISQEALERSHAAFDGAQATLNAFQESLKGLKKSTSVVQTQAGYAKILAPFSGIVTKRWNEPGDLASPGKPILTVQKISPYKIVAQVPPDEMSQVKKGAKVYLKNAEQTMAASVSRVYPALGKNLLGSIEMILPVSPFGLPSGSSIGLDVVHTSVSGLLVPENALVKTDKGSFVYVVTNNVVNVKPVKILGIGGGKAAVSGEIKEGDAVAIGQENMLLTLTEGVHVQPIGGKQ